MTMHLTAADDVLANMVREKEELRDYLLGLAASRLEVTQDTLDMLAYIEQKVDYLLIPKWQQAQRDLANATAEDENDFSLLGLPLPNFFAGLTPETLPGLKARAKKKYIRLTASNPSTLISQGRLDG